MFYICRAQDPEDAGHWELGSFNKLEKVCQIRYLSGFLRYNSSHYEVLHNENGAVRLKWEVTQSDNITEEGKFPPNVVSVEKDNFIARNPFISGAHSCIFKWDNSTFVRHWIQVYGNVSIFKKNHSSHLIQLPKYFVNF